MDSKKQQLALKTYPSVLFEAGDLKGYFQILTHYKFLADKLNHPNLNVEDIVADYEYIHQPDLINHPDWDAEKIDTLKLIQETLNLSAHVFRDNPEQLTAQLLGRLLGFAEKKPYIHSFLQQGRENITPPALIPYLPSLRPPRIALIGTLSSHRDPVSAVALTPDGSKIVSGSWDQTIKVWDLSTGEALLTLLGHTKEVRAIAITPDGSKIVSGSSDQTIKVWDLATGTELHTLSGHSDFVNAVAVTPDGAKIVSGSSDQTIKVWDLATGTVLHTLSGHDEGVRTVIVTPDGTKIVSGSNDRMVKVWDLATGTELHTLSGHGDRVRAVAVAPDGTKIVSGSNDRMVKVWDLETGRCLTTFRADASIPCCVISPDGHTVIAGDNAGQLHFLELIV